MKHIQKSEEPSKLSVYRKDNPNGKWQDFRNECQSGLEEVYAKLSPKIKEDFVFIAK
jgi:hypothetical protein